MKLKKFGLFVLAGVSAGALVWQAASAQQPSLTTETYGNWTYRCTNPAADKGDANAKKENTDSTAQAAPKKACETIQVLRDSKGNVIAQIAFGKDAVEPKKLLGVFQVPQGTLLSEPVRFGVENGTDPLVAPYFTCLQSVCLARIDTDAKALKKFNGKKNGTLEFADRSGRRINVLLSLDGFSSAIGRLTSDQ